MKVAVICANGRVGKLIVKEATERGLDITAFAKGENESVATNYVEKDLYDLTKEDLKGFDIQSRLSTEQLSQMYLNLWQKRKERL